MKESVANLELGRSMMNDELIEEGRGSLGSFLRRLTLGRRPFQSQLEWERREG